MKIAVLHFHPQMKTHRIARHDYAHCFRKYICSLYKKTKYSSPLQRGNILLAKTTTVELISTSTAEFPDNSQQST